MTPEAKTKHSLKRLMIAFLGGALITMVPRVQCAEFTYQGQLKENDSPITGYYDFTFELFDAETGGSSLGSITNATIQVSAGFFAVVLNFGSGVFDDGFSRWLEIGVRPNGSGSFSLIESRSKITPAPSALHAAHSAGGAPLGVVIDWWRADAGTPIPEGYQVCDGSPVSDPESPMYGQTLPDLRGKFIMGSTDGTTIGQSGGSTTHSHSVNIDHDHANSVTTSGGGHTHNVDVPAFSASGSTSASGDHQHVWLRRVLNDYMSYNSAGTEEFMIAWNNGLDKEGAGVIPIGDDDQGGGRQWYTEAAGSHAHSYSLNHDHPSFLSGSAPAHTHSVDLPSLGTLSRSSTTGSHLPPYFGLIKIMRVK